MFLLQIKFPYVSIFHQLSTPQMRWSRRRVATDFLLDAAEPRQGEEYQGRTRPKPSLMVLAHPASRRRLEL